jgi:anti-sigma B factor antagonist
MRYTVHPQLASSKDSRRPLRRGTQTGRPETRVITTGLRIGARLEGTVTIVVCAGAVNHGDAERFAEVFQGLLESGRQQFVIDFAGLTYIDSTMLAETIASLRHAKDRGGSVKLVSPTGTNVRHILKITALDRSFEVFDNVREALKDRALAQEARRG